MLQAIVQPVRAQLSLTALAVIGALGMAAIWALFPIFTIDVANDYVPWFNHIAAAGALNAFAAPFGAYTPPYLYLLAAMTPLKGVIPDPYIIKTLSMICNLMLAGAMWHLLRRLPIAQPHRFATALLALPSLVLNAALLSQCDALYVAPIVMAIAAMLDRRHAAMLAWCGLAVAIKMQAVLIGPFILTILIARRVPFHLWLLAPAAFVAAMLPAALAGWPWSDLLTIYFRETGKMHGYMLNAPNIWTIASAIGIDIEPLTGLAIAAGAGAAAAYCARFGATLRHFSTPMLLRVALLCPLVMAGILPRMHERYFILADILSVVVALASPDPRDRHVPALIQIGSCFAIFAYVGGIGAFATIGAIPMIVATWLVARPLIIRAANDNPLLARPI